MEMNGEVAVEAVVEAAEARLETNGGFKIQMLRWQDHLPILPRLRHTDLRLQTRIPLINIQDQVV